MTNLSESVEKAIHSGRIGVKDVAAAELCRHYAALIDDAERLAMEAELVWAELDLEDIDGRRRLAKLETIVSARTTASDLGPKLLAGLTALGLTLAGRGAKGDASNVPDPKRASHDEIAARRAQRKHDAPAPDATAR